MMGLPSSAHTRKQLRWEVSQYLLDRMHEQWMLEMLVTAQELEADDVKVVLDNQSSGHDGRSAPDAAVAEDPAAPASDQEAPPENVLPETMEAMQWVTNLDLDANILGLIRSLPAAVVEEQVAAWRNRETSAVAADVERDSGE